MEKLNMQTPDMVDENIKKVGALFPNCITERKDSEGKVEYAIDFDVLKQELSKDVVSGDTERYQFTWPDKKKAIILANSPIDKALRPVYEKSINFNDTGNLYIEGDNLDVLKLLRENYLHKVKMIYIDPPYNTGNDFVYKDDFSKSVLEYALNSGQTDEEGNTLVANRESNGRFHTDWLNMLYPRLKVARDLMTEDGVIFISLDDNEANNAIKICDEIFGASNKIAQLVTINNPRGRQSDTFFATVHEYLLCYAKNREEASINGMPLTDEQMAEYSLSDSNGRYRLLGLRQRGVASLREDRPDMYFPIYVNPSTNEVSLEYHDSWACVIPKKSDGREGRWMWGRIKCSNELDRLVPKFITRRKEYDIYVKDYLKKGDNQRTRKFKSVLDDKSFNNQNGTQEVKALLGGDYMSFPKSMEYIKSICSIGSDKDSLILDFFSGSGTTAHAVMQLNAEDGGKRRFIMVQLPEKISEEDKAYKAGYKTICDLGEDRIRRAGLKVVEVMKTKQPDLFDQDSNNPQLDIGFRVLKVDSSNMTDVFYRPKDYTGNLFDYVEDNIKTDRTPEDLLFQVMLETDIPLSAKIEKETIDGKEFFNVADGVLIASFDKNLTDEAIIEVAKRQPMYFVMRNSSAASDSVITNFDTIFKTYSKDTVRKIL